MSEVQSKMSLMVAARSKESWPETRAAVAYRALSGYQNIEDGF